MSTVFDDMAGNPTKGGNHAKPTGFAGNPRPARLCYVDDSRTSAYVVKRMLKPFGYTVDHFNSAEPALVALVQNEYDLLLTDLKVSPKGMDGDDLVRALRNSGHGKISSMPIIVITGSTDTDILAKVYDAGANQIMTKPVNGDELDAHIRELVFSSSSTGAYSSRPTSAEVVPFDQEMKGSPDREASLDNSDVDSGILKKRRRRDRAKDKSEIELDRQPIDSANRPSARRLLRPEPSTDSRSSVATPPELTVSAELNEESVNTPKPSRATKPAPRVRPNLVNNATNKAVSSAAEPVPSLNTGEITLDKFPGMQFDASKIEHIELKESVTADLADSIKSGVTVSPTTGSPASAPVSRAPNRNAKTNPVANGGSKTAAVSAAHKNKIPNQAEALRKAKALAAAKKAKLAAIKKAQLMQSLQDSGKKQANFNTDQSLKELDSISLSLEPLEGDTVDVFKQKKQAELRKKIEQKKMAATQAKARVRNEKPASAQKSEAPVVTQSLSSRRPAPQPKTRAAESKPQSTQAQSKPAASANSNSAAGNNATASAATSRVPPQAFTQANPAETFDRQYGDILKEINRFPLVQSENGSRGGGIKITSSVRSLFELYGFKKIFMTAAVIVGLYFCYKIFYGVLDEEVPVEVATVEQGEIFQSITVPGKVVSKLRVDVTAAIAGRLTNIYIEEGDTVKKGELLARLDDREAKSNLNRAEANLENAREDVALAERSLERLKQAFEKGAIARQLVEDAEVDLRSAKARESVTEEEVRSAKLSLENPRIVAPFGGTVTSRYAEVGQWVVPSETLFTLVDQSQREIEVHVDAADSGGIAVGQTVSLSSDAFPGLKWSESVTRLAAATNSRGNANTVSVFISLGSSAPALRFGQQVDADIRTAWNPNAMKVPYAAVINKDGRQWVAVMEDDYVQLVEVETGIEDFSHVEIRQGVNIGQTIILANGVDLDEGDHVFIANSKK